MMMHKISFCVISFRLPGLARGGIALHWQKRACLSSESTGRFWSICPLIPMMRCCLLLGCIAVVAAHSNLIYPKPRNAIDSLLPEWSGGKSPYVWQPYGAPPCGCTNGTDGSTCDSAQTCLWFSVGCSIGCKECDGGDTGGANPNVKDRCNSGMKAPAEVEPD